MYVCPRIQSTKAPVCASGRNRHAENESAKKAEDPWEKKEVDFENMEYIGTISRDRLHIQDLFLHGTNSKCMDIVESIQHVTILSSQVPKTI